MRQQPISLGAAAISVDVSQGSAGAPTSRDGSRKGCFSSSITVRAGISISARADQRQRQSQSQSYSQSQSQSQSQIYKRQAKLKVGASHNQPDVTRNQKAKSHLTSSQKQPKQRQLWVMKSNLLFVHGSDTGSG